MSASSLATRLENLVRELALPEGRVVGSLGHEAAQEWVQARLWDLRLEPYAGDELSLPYEKDGQKFMNFAGVIPGTDRRLPPLLIGAHYDSVIPAPCADDNAAAVAIVLGAAARLAKAERERDVVIAIFDAEEPPYFHTAAMGSLHFCRHQRDKRGFHAAMILDLVGHDVTLPGVGALTPQAVRDLLVIQGAESHPGLAEVFQNHQPAKGVSLIAGLNSYLPDMSDHHAFRRAGVPFLFFSCGMWEHYHQPSDTPDRLNYEKMARITATLVDFAEGVTVADLSGRVPESDFTAKLEAESIRRSLGSYLGLMGVRRMESRADVQKFFDKIVGMIAAGG